MDLSIYQCGYEKHRPLQVNQSELSGHYLFCYIISGKGVLRIQRKPAAACSYELSGGTGFLIEPGEGGKYQVVSEEAGDYIWIEFGGYKAGDYLNLTGLSIEQPIYTPEYPEQGEELLQNMLLLFRSKEEFRLRATGYLYLFVDSLIRTSKFKKQAPGEGKSSESYVWSAVRYIEQNYFRHISVEELARHCWLDRSYFGKVFKSVTGQSPQRYLISFRMERAAEELTGGNASIGDVGAAVGYPNLLHFSRAFKGVYGISPREYRQRHGLAG